MESIQSEVDYQNEPLYDQLQEEADRLNRAFFEEEETPEEFQETSTPLDHSLDADKQGDDLPEPTKRQKRSRAEPKEPRTAEQQEKINQRMRKLREIKRRKKEERERLQQQNSGSAVESGARAPNPTPTQHSPPSSDHPRDFPAHQRAPVPTSSPHTSQGDYIWVDDVPVKTSALPVSADPPAEIPPTQPPVHSVPSSEPKAVSTPKYSDEDLRHIRRTAAAISNPVLADTRQPPAPVGRVGGKWRKYAAAGLLSGLGLWYLYLILTEKEEEVSSPTATSNGNAPIAHQQLEDAGHYKAPTAVPPPVLNRHRGRREHVYLASQINQS